MAAAIVVGAIAAAGARAYVASDDDAETAPAAVSPRVSKLVRGLSPAEKVDSVLIAGFEGRDPRAIGAELERRPLGGVLVSAENWAGAGPGKTLIAAIRRHSFGGARIAPLIVARQEGGAQRSFGDLPPTEAQPYVGELGKPRLTELWSKTIASALRKAGFDLNLGLVADVGHVLSPLADRVFADDEEVVAEMATTALRGCRDAGLACAVLHFPGLGGASEDTANGPATVSLDAEALMERDLLPFRASFAERVPAVVLSHAFYAAYDPVTPGSLTPAIADELLREELGFEGVAITDDLLAGAITAGPGVPTAAVAAIGAGADMILISDPVAADQARAALLRAVRQEEVPRQRLDEAVSRVLELKRRMGLLGK